MQTPYKRKNILLHITGATKKFYDKEASNLTWSNIRLALIKEVLPSKQRDLTYSLKQCNLWCENNKQNNKQQI